MMKRSDYIDIKHPRPLDRDVETVYRAFSDLTKEVTRDWANGVAAGQMVERGYRDLLNCRGAINDKGQFVVTLIPDIGLDTVEDLMLYSEFFRLYKKLSDSLLLKMYVALSERELPLTKHVQENRKTQKIWRQYNNDFIHKLVMTLKMLVSLMNMNELNNPDLVHFENVMDPEDTTDAADAIAKLIRAAEIEALISAEFVEGKATYWQYPDQTLISGYWNYVHLKMVRDSEPDMRWMYDRHATPDGFSYS